MQIVQFKAGFQSDKQLSKRAAKQTATTDSGDSNAEGGKGPDRNKSKDSRPDGGISDDEVLKLLVEALKDAEGCRKCCH